jgi:hypothetical protein
VLLVQGESTYHNTQQACCRQTDNDQGFLLPGFLGILDQASVAGPAVRVLGGG